MWIAKKTLKVLKIKQQRSLNYPEQHVINYLRSRNPKLQQDEYGNLYYIQPNTPLLCAHMDTVQTIAQEQHHHKIHKKEWKIHSVDAVLGWDDRVWVAMAMQLHEDFPQNTSLLFTRQEEVGLLWAASFCKNHKDLLENITYWIVMDRKWANDFIWFNNSFCSKEFEDEVIDIIKEFWFKAVHWWASDTRHLADHFNAFNISVGYYNPHTVNEYVVLDEVENTYNALHHLIANFNKKLPKYEYKITKTEYKWWNALENKITTFDWLDKDKLKATSKWEIFARARAITKCLKWEATMPVEKQIIDWDSLSLCNLTGDTIKCLNIVPVYWSTIYVEEVTTTFKQIQPWLRSVVAQSDWHIIIRTVAKYSTCEYTLKIKKWDILVAMTLKERSDLWELLPVATITYATATTEYLTADEGQMREKIILTIKNDPVNKEKEDPKKKSTDIFTEKQKEKIEESVNLVVQEMWDGYQNEIDWKPDYNYDLCLFNVTKNLWLTVKKWNKYSISWEVKLVEEVFPEFEDKIDFSYTFYWWPSYIFVTTKKTIFKTKNWKMSCRKWDVIICTYMDIINELTNRF